MPSEIAVALVEARREESDRRDVAFHGQTDQVFSCDVRGGFDRAHIDAAHDARAAHFDRFELVGSQLEIRRGGGTQVDRNVGQLCSAQLALRCAQRVLAHGQVRKAEVALGIGLHRAGEASVRIDRRSRRLRPRSPRWSMLTCPTSEPSPLAAAAGRGSSTRAVHMTMTAAKRHRTHDLDVHLFPPADFSLRRTWASKP